MNTLILYSVIAILTVLSLGLAAWLFYIKFIARPTREKYAFTALFALTSLVALAFTTAFYQTPWTAIMGLIAHYAGLPAPQFEELNSSDKILIFLFVSWMAWLIQRTFSQWNGAISENQAEQQKRHEDVLFISEGIKMLLGKYEEKDLQLHNQTDYSNQPSALEVPSDSLAWRIQAIELLTLRWHNYYRFKTENDENWHEKVHCWLGENIKQNKTTAVLCIRQNPNDAEIKAFIDYVSELNNELTQCEMIIIVQQGEAEKIYSLENNIKIQQYSEAWLLDGLVDFEDYFLDLKKRAEFDCLPDSELKLPDIYVPSALKGENNQSIEEDLETYLRNWLNEAGQRQLALLGEYGQGKSTGTLMFSHHLVQQYNGKPPRIPILLELRGKSPKTLDPLGLLAQWTCNYRIDPKALMKLQQAGRLLLIFEGFDEMAEVSDGDARFNHFRSLWRFCYPKAKILITGRPNFFLDDRELKALLGVDQSTATGAYVQALHLQPFSPAQIEASLRTATAQNRREISQLAAQDSKFYDIVARPSLLYIVGQLWDKSELRARQQDVNSALVIGLFIQHSYKRQTEKIRDGRQFMVLNELERSYFMDGIAAFMAKGKLPNQITLPQFNQIVEQLYAVIPEEVSLQGNALSSNTSKPLKLRLQDNDDPLEAVKTDVRTYGILVKDLTRANALKFPHKSFLEYLFANYCVQRLMDKANVSAAAIWKVTQAEPENVIRTSMLGSLEFAAQLLCYTDKIKPIYANKSLLQKELFNIITNDSVHSYIFNKIKIELCFNIERIKVFLGIGIISMGICLAIKIIFLHSTSKEFKISLSVFFMLLFGLIELYVLRHIFLRRKYLVWFFLSISLNVKYKDMKKAYGKTIADKLSELSKKYNAEYLLEKYNYYEDD
ncbi:MAG: hypothetical protein WAX77_05745 [Methylococcaceae bacterium]